jgi:glycosyltransferase involved in cell wall biosynthesis
MTQQTNEVSTQPLVSICIPIYNAESYVDEIVHTCLRQTYQNLEVIFSDNCSTDATIKRIESYSDPRIRLFRNESNEGLVSNFKKVFTYASGKYMSFLAADDGMRADCIEKCVAILEDPRHSNVALVNTHIEVIDGSGQHMFVKGYIPRNGVITSYWALRCNLLTGTNVLGEPNGSVWRRAAYEQIPEPKFRNANTWTIDLDLKSELLLHGDAYMLAEPLGKFRVSAESTSVRELKLIQAVLFRKWALGLYHDKRYGLSYFWVVTATANSYIIAILRNIFYLLFAKRL